MCVCWFCCTSLNIPQCTDMEHIIEYTCFRGGGGGGGDTSMFIVTHMSSRSRSVPFVRTARRSCNAFVLVAVALWMCLKVTLQRFQIPLWHLSLEGEGWQENSELFLSVLRFLLMDQVPLRHSSFRKVRFSKNLSAVSGQSSFLLQISVFCHVASRSLHLMASHPAFSSVVRQIPG